MTGLEEKRNDDGSIEKRSVGVPVKKAVQNLVLTAQANYDKELRGEKPLDIALHRLFIGNPGTGKTTVARIYGRILRALGLLSNGVVVLKGGGDFISGHEGGTEEATLAILENAKGKVLVIDEAYTLDGSNRGKIAIDMMVSKLMGRPGEDIAVLLLGHEASIMRMISNHNPVLGRCFNLQDALVFPDFNDQELRQVLKERLSNLTMGYETQKRFIDMLAS